MAERSWKGTVLIACAALAGLAIMVSEDYINRALEREQQFNEGFYSTEISQAAQARAERWYTALFIDTGVVQTSFDTTLPTRDDTARSPAVLRTFGGEIFRWWEGRLRSLWAIIWQVFLRVSHLLIWWPYAIILATPWVVDGWVSRKVNQHNFRLSSPIQNSAAVFVIEAVVFVGVAALLLPVAIHPMAVPAAIIAVAVAANRLLANFMKRA